MVVLLLVLNLCLSLLLFNYCYLAAVEVESMLNEMLALLFKTLNSESIEVASSVIEFAQLYVNRLKTQKVTPTQIEHLQVFLQIIRNKVFTYSFLRQ